MPTLSVIIPTLNEAGSIEPALERLQAQAPQVQLVVVDGGSTDDTVSRAQKLARVLESPPGRAEQLNLGARRCRGEWMLFLHADTRLPDGFTEAVEAAAADGYKAGAFRLRIEGSHPLLPVLALGANARTRLRGIALGDQGLFVQRDLFFELGGYPPVPIGEDYAFARRLREANVPFFLSAMAAETSGRRWDRHGFWHTWWQHRRFYWRYHRGGDLGSLRQEYTDVR